MRFAGRFATQTASITAEWHTSVTVHGRYQVPAQNVDLETVMYTDAVKKAMDAAAATGGAGS